MNGKPTTYIINVAFNQPMNVQGLLNYLHDSREIVAYWNYLPFVFCVKSYLNAPQLSERLRPYLPSMFMIAQINELNIEGVLPQEAWSWFYMDHHEKRAPLPSLLEFNPFPSPFDVLPPPTKK